jgi:hypothetical protein
MKKESIIYSAILFILILTSAYFFSLSGIKLETFLTIDLISLLETFVSIWFIIFLILASFSLAVILLIIKNVETTEDFAIMIIFYLAGIIISLLIFNLFGFILPLLIAIIGIIIATKTIEQKEKEFKSMPVLRAGANAGGKIIIFVALGLFLTLLFTTIPNAKQYEEGFVDDIFEVTIGEEENLKNSINEPVIEALVESQRQTLDSVKELPGFDALDESSDNEVLIFVTNFEALSSVINSDNYKEEIKQQFEGKSEELDLGEGIVGQLPIIKEIAKYAWLLYAFSGLVLVFLFGNLIVKNIAGLV